MPKAKPDLREIDTELIRAISNQPGITYQELITLFKDFVKNYISERTCRLHRVNGLIIRTRERVGLPVRYWPINHPDAPIEWVLP